MGAVTRVQVRNKAIFISYYSHTFGKGMHLTILLLAMGK